MVSQFEPKQEYCKPGAVQGCGNPNCTICLPQDGRGGGALAGSPDDMANAFATLRDEMFKSRDAIFRSFSFNINDPGGTYAPSGRLFANAKAEEEERVARGPVQKFLLRGDLGVTWSDIVGNEDAHAAMVEAIEFPVKHRELYAFYGKKPTKGILLNGPPGCGKTMFGKAAASIVAKLHGVSQAAMLNVKAAEIQSPFVGETERLIRQIFAYARAYKKLHGHQLVIFIDEADAILPSRDGIGGRRALPWEESNVATFLAEMDGVEESAALVILATNRPHAIDSALLREGRIDRKITVRRPTPEAARAIFAKALASAPTMENRDQLVAFAMEEFFYPLRKLLKVKTERGYDFLTLGHIVSGAMMVGLVERIKANAFHRDIAAGSRSGITRADITAAIDKLVEENLGRPDIYALQEFAQALGLEILEIAAIRPEIKFVSGSTDTLQ